MGGLRKVGRPPHCFRFYRQHKRSVVRDGNIHSKNEHPGRLDSAKYFAFSAKILTENAKSIKFVLFVELTLPFPLIMPSHCLKLR